MEALPISEPVSESVDILFLGNSYYAFSIDPEVKKLMVSLGKTKTGIIVNFGSAAMLNSTYKKVKAEADMAMVFGGILIPVQGFLADKVGILIDEREFHCKVEFEGVYKGNRMKQI